MMYYGFNSLKVTKTLFVYDKLYRESLTNRKIVVQERELKEEDMPILKIH